jgi:hypothetical protein
MARWTRSTVTDLPVVSDGEPDDPTWYPLQHALGIDTFGANVFVARQADQVLVDKHDERESGQQELYLLLEAAAAFDLDGEETRLERGDALAVTDPSVHRGARALEEGRRCSSWAPRTGRSSSPSLLGQSGSSGMEKPGSRPSRTARVIAALPKRSRIASTAASTASSGPRSS